jgi:hypothetical protein
LLQTRFRKKREKINREEGNMFKWINGIKCMVKYQVFRQYRKTFCAITVYSKIHSKPMELMLKDIDEIDGFNARAIIRKLRINIGG